ncbi:MAG: hypothetical protein AAFX09_08270 [Pseudomonadota bacterium]
MNQRKTTPPPFSMRFTDEERAILNVRTGNKPLAQYIREKLFGDAASPRAIKRRKPGVDQALLSQALGLLGQSRLASNINQIAKAAHMGALPVTPDLAAELDRACADIRLMRQLLLRALGKTKA